MSYYGDITPIVPIRSLSKDLVDEREQLMLEELKVMEMNIKRHITDAKREIIREILNGENCKLIKETIKDKINGQKSK